jgi:hypothetical protein
MYILTHADRLVVPVLCVALMGCASVTPLPYAEVASSSYLAPNPSDASGRIPYRFSTAVDWRSYDKVIFDPVVIYRGPDQQFQDVSEESKAALASYMQTRFAEKLRSHFALVSRRAPNTLRGCAGGGIEMTPSCRIFDAAAAREQPASALYSPKDQI